MNKVVSRTHPLSQGNPTVIRHVVPADAGSSWTAGASAPLPIRCIVPNSGGAARLAQMCLGCSWDEYERKGRPSSIKAPDSWLLDRNDNGNFDCCLAHRQRIARLLGREPPQMEREEQSQWQPPPAMSVPLEQPPQPRHRGPPPAASYHGGYHQGPPPAPGLDHILAIADVEAHNESVAELRKIIGTLFAQVAWLSVRVAVLEYTIF